MQSGRISRHSAQMDTLAITLQARLSKAVGLVHIWVVTVGGLSDRERWDGFLFRFFYGLDFGADG